MGVFINPMYSAVSFEFVNEQRGHVSNVIITLVWWNLKAYSAGLESDNWGFIYLILIRYAQNKAKAEQYLGEIWIILH